MNTRFIFPVLSFLFISFQSFSQETKIDSIGFFKDESVIKMTLSTDMKGLIANKMKMQDQPAAITLQFADNSIFAGDVTIRARGITRKETCNMPPLMINFKNSGSAIRPLDKLKLVCGCGNTAEDERMALKEYLAYKIYNQLSDMSFRVRLALITYEDSKGKRKPMTQYGFFIEDVDVMAKRNGCKELNKTVISQTATDRDNMTMVEIFQYMIGIDKAAIIKIIRNSIGWGRIIFSFHYQFYIVVSGYRPVGIAYHVLKNLNQCHILPVNGSLANNSFI